MGRELRPRNPSHSSRTRELEKNLKRFSTINFHYYMMMSPFNAATVPDQAAWARVRPAVRLHRRQPASPWRRRLQRGGATAARSPPRTARRGGAREWACARTAGNLRPRSPREA